MFSRTLTIGLLLGTVAVGAQPTRSVEPLTTVQRVMSPASRLELLEPASAPPLFPPTYDTLYRHDYSVSQLAHGGPTSGDAWLFGLGVKLTPTEYPAVLVGLSHRTYRDPRSPTQGLMQVRITDDDGAGGSPGTVLTKLDTQADTWDWAFHYDVLPFPYDTLWDGSF